MFLDLAGTLFSLLYIYYFIRMDNKVWYVGILASCFNTCAYWKSGIYADMCLEVFYFLFMIYGWYKWQHDSNDALTVNRLSITHWILLSLSFILGFILIYLTLISFTLSNVPVIDSLTTTLSLVAQWLMCHKSIVTWIFWFIVDALYFILYLTKNLPFHAFLMIIYTGMAITGYLMWAKTNKESRSEIQAA